MTPPTCAELMWDDGFTSVHRALDDSWRHGNRVAEVFCRVFDNTYWLAEYRVSGDGETNELRDGDASITQVYKRVVMEPVVRYTTTP